MVPDSKYSSFSSIELWFSRNLLVVLISLLGFGLLLSGIVILTYCLHFSGPISSDHGVWGEFGDFVGGSLNPVFGLLSLLALLLTLTIQNRELSISTQELRNSVKALMEQSESLRLQNFERTFFELLKLYTESVQAINLRDSGGTVTSVGRDCFRVFYGNRLRFYYDNTLSEMPRSDDLSIIQTSYGQFFKADQHEIGHCFRTLYRVFKYIHESDFTNRQQYASVMRAQLSSYELALLFYNGLHPAGEKLKPLIEYYALLENAQLELLFSPSTHIPLYSKRAYGDQDLNLYVRVNLQ